VNLAFQDMKKFELARDNQVAQENSEVARREQTALDDLGVDLHRRNTPDDQG
jgi:hypothetical protein